MPFQAKVYNKYTIFDNFDKLDLSPVASLFRQDSLTSTPFYIYVSATQSGIINYNTFNETGISNISNNPRPIAYSSANMETGVVPDMFKYITNNRFYISAGAKGEIYHTSKLNFLQNVSSLKDSILADNVFYNQFFFNIFLREFTGIFADAVRLYNNPFYTPNVEGNYNAAIQNYHMFDLQGNLADNFFDLMQFNPMNTLIGNNIPIFINETENYAQLPAELLIQDLFVSSDYMSVLEVLKNENQNAYNQAILFLQRLLYPVRTAEGGIPKHHYFVSDLEKSNNVYVTPVYNYDPLVSKDDVLLEWQLPNIYAYYSYLSFQEETNISNYYLDIVKLDHEGDLNLDNFSIQKYYHISKNSQDYVDLADSPTDEDYAKYEKLFKHKYTVFGRDFSNMSADLATVKNLFPIYNEIMLPPSDSDVMQFLNDLDLGYVDFFMNLFANYFRSNDGGVHTFCLHNKEDETTSIALTDLQVVDINKAINPDLNFWGYSFFRNNKFAFSKFDLIEPDYNEDVKNIKDMSTLLLAFIKGRSENYKLTYSDIYNGEKCHSEILAYEVVKYGLIGEEKTELQRFFVPNLQGAHTLIDTQVFHDKQYIYEVFSISLVVGAEYSSVNLPDTDTPSTESEAVSKSSLPPLPNLEVVPLLPLPNPLSQITDYESTDLIKIVNHDHLFTNTPRAVILPQKTTYEDTGAEIVVGSNLEPNPSIVKPIIVRAPYFNTLYTRGGSEQKKTIILDKPPLPPDISFYPYKDIDNKVLITLGVNYGEKRLIPVRVFPGDIEQIQKHYENQKGTFEPLSFNNEGIDSYLNLAASADLSYKTDGFLGTYKIWRTTQKPADWSAFYSSVPVEINNESSTAFEDEILPNVDYYYFARFEDIYGHFSNPTDIFYLRMVREGGFPPYLIVKTYDFSEARAPIVYEKSFKKYLKIRLANGTRKLSNTDDSNKIDFGYEKVNSDSQLKKYKIRITSKKTGKKIDINVDFNKDISNQYLTDISNTATSADPTVPTAYTTDEGLFVDEKVIAEQAEKMEQKLKASAETPKQQKASIEKSGIDVVGGVLVDKLTLSD